MNIGDGLKEFLKKTAIFLGNFDVDMELSYDTDVLSVFFDNLNIFIPEEDALKSVMNIVEDFISDGSIDLNLPITSYAHVRSLELVYLSKRNDTKYRLRNFVCTTNSGSIIPVKYFQESEKYLISDTEQMAVIRKIREIILHFGKPTTNQTEVNKYLSKIKSNEKNTIIALYNNVNSKFTSLYSKCYLKYLLSGNKTVFPSQIVHNFAVDISLISDLEISNRDYTQFFEIFDVIDEYHHSSDLLIKYLKLYQIIEYFITRNILVKIQSNNSNQNLFLREMSGLAKYDDFDKNNFNNVFKANEVDLGNWFMNLLKSSSGLKLLVETLLYNNTKTVDENNRNNCYNALLQLIYKLRNSIVHNKESEIHLTIHNVLLKKDMIKLLKDLIKKLEKILFKKIIDFENTIAYQKRSLDLY